MADHRVDLHLDGQMLQLTLDRPDRKNTVDDQLIRDLGAGLDHAESDPDCRAVVIAASGGFFCAGMDIASAAGQPPDDQHTAQEFFRLLRRFTASPRVIVSLVAGQVAGGGVGLVAASDLVYATPASTFGLPEALWGLLPCCVLPFLIRRVGFQKAYSMALTTLPAPAAEAACCGLVDAASDDLPGLLRRLSQRLSKVDPVAIGDLKRYVAGLPAFDLDVEQLAVTELARLTSSPRLRARFAAFARDGRFPWDAPASGT